MKILMKKVDESERIDCSYTAKVALLATVCSTTLFPHQAKGISEPLPSQDSTVQVRELSVADSSQQILDAATGYLHPFLSVAEVYSDNIFYTNQNEKDDFYTIISPGLWVATPRSKGIVLDIDPSNTAPGGLAYELQKISIKRKLQAYALYEADIYIYASENQNNTTTHTAEGMFSYALPAGLTLSLIDKYIHSFDDFQSDGSSDDDLQKYDSNVLIVSAEHTFSPKFSIEGIYSNFYLDYDETESSYRDRTDNTGSLYFNYNYSPKTSLFLNGEYIQSSFDTATENDADQYNLYGGIQWRPSGKTNLRMRLGYVNRSFDSRDVEDVSEFAGDVRVRYRLTGKTSLTLVGLSNIQVTNDRDYTFFRNEVLRLGCHTNFTSKISADLVADFGWRDYQGGIQADRNDDYFRITPSLQYDFKKWMTARLSYSYETRDSNIEINDYDTNTVLLKLIFSL